MKLWTGNHCDVLSCPCELIRPDTLNHFSKVPTCDWVMPLSEQAAYSFNIKAKLAILSVDYLFKNLMRHGDLPPESYQLLQKVCKKPDVIIKAEARGRLILVSLPNLLMVVVKVDVSQGKAFIISFRRTKPKDIARLKRNGEVILGDGG
ncbi:hypothetical protein JCM15519_04190 [Fundidesulfovibrio butyratiphilus]